MGFTLSPLISPARNWTYLSCLSDDGSLMGGIHLAGHALMWDRAERQRGVDQDSVMVGGEGKTITDVAAPSASYVTPYRWPLIIIETVDSCIPFLSFKPKHLHSVTL